jgi:hypothetical protein
MLLRFKQLCTLCAAIFCVTLFCGGHALAFETEFELHPHKAIYSAKIKKGISISGTATRELVKQGEQWLYRFDVDSMAADIKERVLLTWRDNRVIPSQYDYSLSGFFIKDRHRKASYDWIKALATGQRNDDKWQLELPDGAVDRLGYQLQLAADIASGHSTVNYEIVHKGRIEPSQFAIVGESVIETILGKSNAILVKKVRAPEKKRETFLWFSKDKPLLLLKMTQKEKDGEEYEVHLKKLDYYHFPENK